MNTNVMTLIQALTPDNQADEIINDWARFKTARTSWESEMLELRAFHFATSTRTTESSQPDFKNSTTIPKLAEIATNIRANSAAHLFGNPNWAQFEAFDKDAASLESRKVVEAYVRTKVRRQGYETILGTVLDDWLFAGCCFAQQRYVTETGVDATGQPTILYQGPVLERIAPQDIAFDVTASSFKAARKIIRKIYTLGDIAKMVKSDVHTAFTEEMLEEMRSVRTNVRGSGIVTAPEGVDWASTSLTRDGFGDILNYMNSDLVEIHEFYGDMYSLETGEFLENYKIVVIDRRKVISAEPIVSANGSQYIYYTTPETRPDNLLGMSPLARIVGMQFKLDKLENMRADIFDRIANPITVEIGDVEFHGVRGVPGGRYVVDETGDVRHLVPDTTVLQADFQIGQTMQLMEELAGSPRNTSGFRTPGEKTKFEVQFLENGANRIFRDRTKKFEQEFLEPILNDMVQLGRENLGESDLVSTEGEQFKSQEFIAVTKDMLAVSGKLRARGSALFAEKANALQNLIGIIGSPAFPVVQRHFSTIKLATALEELGDLQEFKIVTENIAIQEDQASQRLAEQAQSSTTAASVAASMPEPEDEDDLGETDELPETS